MRPDSDAEPSSPAVQEELTATDLESVREHGLQPAEARRQLGLLRDPPPPVTLVAPCTREKGIESISQEESAAVLAAWEEAAMAGRILKFVPASGAASRMFASLVTGLATHGRLEPLQLETQAAEGDPAAHDLLVFLRHLREFPFFEELSEVLGRDGLDPEELAAACDLRALLGGLLEERGLGYARRPKGLVAFHRGSTGIRTPVDEHLAEALELVRSAEGRSRVHFTVPAGFEEPFRVAVAKNPEAGSFEATFSCQSPATDTLAVGPDSRPFRTEDGELLFRPGGHGSLLRNLEELGADLVLVKNIDNVQTAERRAPGIHAQRLLLGHLVRLERQVRALLQGLRRGAADPARNAEALTFVRRHFQPEAETGHDWSQGELRDRLVERLRRPLRVCGMVPNEGEPGGGPFWIRPRRGELSKAIVEASEVADTEGQQAVFRAATHFNPVLLALSLRDEEGDPYRLADWVDESRIVISHRTHGGVPLKALERPGLWNGAMGFWNTVFVEVTLQAFSPVKTVYDLLRPEHRAPSGAGGLC